MLLFPLPFLTAFFLVFVLLQLARYAGRGIPILLLVTIGAYALQSILVGMQWGLMELPRIAIASLANVLPPLTWLTLNTLAGRSGPGTRVVAYCCLIGIPVILFGAFYFQISPIIDITGILVYAIFGAHLVWLGWRQELGWMASRPLNAIVTTQRAYLLVGIVLLISAGVDMMVATDIRLNDSQISPALVGYSNLVLLLILVMVYFRASWQNPSRVFVRPREPDDKNGPDAMKILELLDREMAENHLYRSESLSLNQIARRIGVPARQVSSAVNSIRAMNVPQYVNTFRIRDACRMLEDTDTSIGDIVFDVGFTTKSNFNREFQRITGVSPSAWRARS